jgi:carbamoyl-phosphate synthase small subunit
MELNFNRKLVLEDGSEYFGYAFGAKVDKVLELVFNTSMVGYQEVISDLTYANQMVVMTYPIIGSYGIIDEDMETKAPVAGGLVVRDYNDNPSNFRYTKTLSEILEENNIPGIWGLDTRKLTRNLRDTGTKKVYITDASFPKEEALKIIETTPIEHDAVQRLSCTKRWYSRTTNPKYNVVIVDCGVKTSLVKSINKSGCNVTVVPYNTSAEEILKMHPDGILLSDGPSDPHDAEVVIDLVKALKGRLPICGVGLGHQIIGLAYGATTSKLKFGHRGSNHPIKDTKTGKIMIQSQNHGYVIDNESVKNTDLTVTHINVLDSTIEGVECEKDKVFSVQYEPEDILNIKDTEKSYIFSKFVSIMKEVKDNA